MKLTGKERDAETGLDYFGARYFSAAQGRFTSPDQPLIGGNPSNPQSWNLYSYTLNNPLRYVDPTGHDPNPVDKSPECAADPRCLATIGPPPPPPNPLPPGSGGIVNEAVDKVQADVKFLGNTVIGIANLFGADITPLAPTNQTQQSRMAQDQNSPVLPGPGMMLLPEGAAPQLAQFVAGGKTAGVLRTAAGDTELLSGWEGPASSMPKGSPGFDIVTRTHVEGHAAALLQQQGATEGTLFINNPAVCTSCTKLLPSMLPPGVNLRVVLPNGTVLPFTGRVP